MFLENTTKIRPGLTSEESHLPIHFSGAERYPVPFWWHMAPHRLRPWMQWMLEMLVKPQQLIADPLTIGPVQPRASSTQHLARHTYWSYWIFFLNHTWYDHALFVPICPASERKLAKDARDTDLALPSDSSCKKGTRRIKALKGSCSNMLHSFARETGCCNFMLSNMSIYSIQLKTPIHNKFE